MQDNVLEDLLSLAVEPGEIAFRMLGNILRTLQQKNLLTAEEVNVLIKPANAFVDSTVAKLEKWRDDGDISPEDCSDAVRKLYVLIE